MAAQSPFEMLFLRSNQIGASAYPRAAFDGLGLLNPKSTVLVSTRSRSGAHSTHDVNALTLNTLGSLRSARVPHARACGMSIWSFRRVWTQDSLLECLLRLAR